MKTGILLLGSAIAVSATAAAKLFDDDYLDALCNEPGQPCHKIKRAAEAAALALANPAPCTGPADACTLAKRDTDEFLAALSDIYTNYTSQEVEHDVFPLTLDQRVKRYYKTACVWRGEDCPTKSELEDENHPQKRYYKKMCRFRGEPCYNKRDAIPGPHPEPEAKPEPKPEPKADPYYKKMCRFRGEPCYNKRDAGDICRFRGEKCPEKPDLDAVFEEPEEGRTAYKRLAFCNQDGQACSKMKRAAEAIADAMAVPDFSANDKREAGRSWDCKFRGQPCTKKREAEPFCTTCDRARRDLEQLSRAARDFVAS
ncbi:hypothetical protein B0J12DRAFT_763004 [Macrophomina phaseolina]|uniref:Clock-controlled pheromone ccg-4 n=1 Tax=Macrophomina phaseolina TaxID=35725 RepID=A0ABQ8GQA2_9PEZI|nr:hypothetical protein B0J12DRAFT_763004 [Macrophomina phaseolina]